MEKYRKNSLRLPGYDYGSEGAYFLTLCVQKRRCLLSTIEQEEIILSEAGTIVDQEWQKSAVMRPEIYLGVYVIMPNHLHMIAFVMRDEFPLNTPIRGLPQTPGFERTAKAPQDNISALMRGFKSATTRMIRERGIPDFQWQRGFYDRIIRNTEELARIETYIYENPTNWTNDPEYPR